MRKEMEYLALMKDPGKNLRSSSTSHTYKIGVKIAQSTNSTGINLKRKSRLTK
jgi:hypothetical protein